MSPLSTANITMKSFLKYERCPENCKLQFFGHHSNFRKDFQILLAVHTGHVQSQHLALGHT